MDEPRWLDDTEMRAWHALLHAHAVVVARLDAELQAQHGLTLAEYEVLAHVSNAPGQRLRMSELARTVKVSPSGLTRRLDKLQRDGLLARESCPSDRRGTLAVLTDVGLARLRAAAPDHVSGVRRHVVDRLSVAQLAAVAEALEVVSAPCGAHDCGAAPTEEISRSC